MLLSKTCWLGLTAVVVTDKAYSLVKGLLWVLFTGLPYVWACRW